MNSQLSATRWIAICWLCWLCLGGGRVWGQPLVGWGSNEYGQISLGSQNFTSGFSALAVDGGNDHSLVLLGNGNVWALGDDECDQLRVPLTLNNAVAVAAGAYFSMALQSDRQVVVWGDTNSSGPGATNVVAISAGSEHSLLLKSNGSVIGQGWNYSGETSVPANLRGVVAVAAGEEFSIVLLSNGTVLAWGNNYLGQMNVPAGLNDVVAVAAGYSHALALRSNGQVVAWGSTAFGQTAVPTALTDVVAIAAGADHSLALRRNGQVVSWGHNSLGQTNVPSLTGVGAIGCGASHSLAIQNATPRTAPVITSPVFALTEAAGTRPGVFFHYQILATGQPTSFNATGLPMGMTVNSTTGLLSGVATEVGEFKVSLTASNTIGSGTREITIIVNGQLEMNATLPSRLALTQEQSFPLVIGYPTRVTANGLPQGLVIDEATGHVSGQALVPGPFYVQVTAENIAGSFQGVWRGEVTRLAAWGDPLDQDRVPASLDDIELLQPDGYGRTTVLLSDGTVLAWGTPLPTASTKFISIATGGGYTFGLGLHENGLVESWDGPVLPGRDVLNNVTALAAGGSFGLALRSDGRVLAWGTNDAGQTTLPAGLNRVIAIAAGGAHGLALRRDGSVVGWGSNTRGQVSVPALPTPVKAIAAGYLHSLALLENGTVVQWGDASQGQSSVPPNLTGVVAIDAGFNHSLALKNDGTLVAWGRQGGAPAIAPQGLSGVVAIGAGGDHALGWVGTASPISVPVIISRNSAVTSIADASGEIAFYYRIQALGDPTSFSATGLPAGLTLEATTGIISGAASEPGKFRVMLGATNAAGIGTRELSITINAGPIILSEFPVRIPAGLKFTLPLVTSTQANSFSAAGLPPGIYINTATGMVFGRPTQSGHFTVTITARNQWAEATFSYPLEVTPVISWGPTGLTMDPVPTGLQGAVAIANHSLNGLALLQDGRVVNWDSSLYPVSPPSNLGPVEQISLAHQSGFALHQDGSVDGWGPSGQTYSSSSQSGTIISVAAVSGSWLELLNNGTVLARATWSYADYLTPKSHYVTAIASDGFKSFLLKSNGSVEGWKKDYPPSSLGSLGLTEVVAIALGSYHLLAVTRYGTVQAWGDNSAHQCDVPDGLTNVVAVAAGGRHSIALRADGTLVGWGAQQPPAGLRNVVAISASGDQSLALVDTKQHQVPVIISAKRAVTDAVDSGAGNVYFHYRIATLGAATSFTASGLPAGLSLHATSGVIDGQPTEIGSFPITLTASNAVGSGSATLMLQVNGLPVLEAPAYPVSHSVGGVLPVSPFIAVPGATYSALGLPPGLQLDAQSGAISGRPTQTGHFSVTVSLTNIYGTSQVSWEWTVSPVWSWGGSNETLFPSPPGIEGAVGLGIAGYGDQNWFLLRNGKIIPRIPHAWQQPLLDLQGVASMASGHNFVIALKGDGALATWGSLYDSNSPDYLGYVDYAPHTSGAPLMPLTNVRGIACGRSHAVALLSDGSVTAWGYNHFGESTVPGNLTGVTAIAAGVSHSLALKSDGSVIAWGRNTEGQATVPSGLTDVIAIAASSLHSLALKRDGTVVAWGSNENGVRRVPVGLSNVVAISTGFAASMVLKQNGSVVAWGNTYNSGWIPVTIPTALPKCHAIASGWGECYALSGAGLAMPPDIISAPFALTEISGVSVSVPRFYYRIATLGDADQFTATGLPNGLTLDSTTGIISGMAMAVGEFEVELTATNAYGRRTKSLVINVTGAPGLTMNLPIQIHLRQNVSVQLNTLYAPTFSATGLPPGLILDASTGIISGRPSAAGNFSAQLIATNALGSATTTWSVEITPVVIWDSNGSLAPSVPSGLQDTIAVAAGDKHFMALQADGTVNAWGTVYPLGSHGYRYVNNPPIPATPPAGLHDVVAIAAGRECALALQRDGKVVAWGDYEPPFEDRSQLTGHIAISASGRYIATLQDEGTVAQWGLAGDSVPSLRTRLRNIPGAVTIAVGEAGYGFPTGQCYSNYVVLRADGSVTSFSDQENGGSDAERTGRVLNHAVAIAAGDNHSLALKDDGTILGWGYDFAQSLWENDAITNVPPPALQFTNIVAITGDLALTSDGTLRSIFPSSPPLPALAGVIAMSSGQGSSMALLGSPTFLVDHVTASARINHPFTYQIRGVTSGIATFTSPNLPLGLQLNPSTGLITGTPTQNGVYAVDILLTSPASADPPQAQLQLTVSPTASIATTALGLWQERYFPLSTSPADMLSNADPDGDGIPNLIEFARGTDPMHPNNDAWVSARLSYGTLVITVELPSSAAAELNIKAQFSDDLSFGSQIRDAGSCRSSTPTPGRICLTFYDYPSSGFGKCFGRIVVEPR